MLLDFFLFFFFSLLFTTTGGRTVAPAAACAAPCSSASSSLPRVPLDSAGPHRESGLPPATNFLGTIVVSGFSCPWVLHTHHPLPIDGDLVGTLRAALASFDAGGSELAWPATGFPCSSVLSFSLSRARMGKLSRAHHERMPPTTRVGGAYVERDILSAWWGRLGWLSETPMFKASKRWDEARVGAGALRGTIPLLGPLFTSSTSPSLSLFSFPSPAESAAEGQLPWSALRAA